MRLTTMMVVTLMASGCTPLSGNQSNGVPIVEKGSPVPQVIVMRGGKLVGNQSKRVVSKSQPPAGVQLFVPPEPKPSLTFTVDEPVVQLNASDRMPPLSMNSQTSVSIPEKAKKTALPNQIAGANAQVLSLEPSSSSNNKAEINRLTLKYANGDVNAAYKLALLLYKDNRNEEADVVIDYAARKNNISAMRLYSERFKQQGDLNNSQKWLDAAEANSTLATAVRGKEFNGNY